MPESAWQCPHLTSLVLKRVQGITTASIGTLRCTGLRQLHLVSCTFGGGLLPEQLCTRLTQLSQLALMKTNVASLPPALSKLRCACKKEPDAPAGLQADTLSSARLCACCTL